MTQPRICAVITRPDPAAIARSAPLADLFEVRIDLIGNEWPEVARRLTKPWVATNRPVTAGGKWAGDEAARIGELLKAAASGATLVDIELTTKNLGPIVALIKERTACLVSDHNFTETPDLKQLTAIVEREFAAGADVGKVVTTARSLADNATVLQLLKDFPGRRLVAFAMGEAGWSSRILCPLLGGDFTYASLEQGQESAPGQVTVAEMRKFYEVFGEGWKR